MENFFYLVLTIDARYLIIPLYPNGGAGIKKIPPIFFKFPDHTPVQKRGFFRFRSLSMRLPRHHLPAMRHVDGNHPDPVHKHD